MQTPSYFPALDTAPEIAAFQAVLASGGLDAALQFLNRRTEFRYTAVYRLEGAMMRNIHIYDRKSEDTQQLQAVPLGDSFCQFVMKEGGFSTADSASDERLAGHVYQGVLNAYFGLPLAHAPSQELYGTFCHFDFEAKRIAEPEIPFLEAAAPLLMPYLK